jgi:hypothetical protein
MFCYYYKVGLYYLIMLIYVLKSVTNILEALISNYILLLTFLIHNNGMLQERVFIMIIRTKITINTICNIMSHQIIISGIISILCYNITLSIITRCYTTITGIISVGMFIIILSITNTGITHMDVIFRTYDSTGSSNNVSYKTSILNVYNY